MEQQSIYAMPYVVIAMRRYTKDLALRLSEEQREFLEKMAAIKGCGICEAARICIGTEMTRGIEW
jgi:hypothetical protein